MYVVPRREGMDHSFSVWVTHTVLGSVSMVNISLSSPCVYRHFPNSTGSKSEGVPEKPSFVRNIMSPPSS